MNRIIFSDDGTLTDGTVELNNFQTGTVSQTFVALEDAIYYGARVPFNHIYFKFGAAANTNSATLDIDYWDGKEWVSVVDTLDETIGFSQSGFVTFIPDEDERWDNEDTNEMQLEELNQKTIYDHYWIRIKFSANTTAIDFNWIGQKFSNDDDLKSEYPQLLATRYLQSFDVLKTDWEEQHVAAAEIIIQDVLNSDEIDHKEQLMEREQYKRTSIQKVAELIFINLGDDFKDDVKDARSEYTQRLRKVRPRVDKDRDGILEPHEALAHTGFMSR